MPGPRDPGTGTRGWNLGMIRKFGWLHAELADDPEKFQLQNFIHFKFQNITLNTL
jgi:hypothetical protein